MNKTITFADKLTAWFALLSGLSISAVAVWYSVAGLVAIFAASVIPIIVMGVVLELGKLVATVWLKQNWSIAPKLIRLYLFIAVIILMMITSMGIFGYLSKAHLDQAVPTGNVVAQVAIFDEKIKTAKENIESGRRALKQMDATIDETIARSKGEQGAMNANAMRTRQAKERTQIQADIARSQVEIAKLNEQRAPIAAELRKVEAEVGPIKYIAALLYNDDPDTNTLEKAVRFVIILIVVIFDPLAVVLLLASQYSFAWFRKQDEEQPAVVAVPAAESVEAKKKEPTITMVDSDETANLPQEVANPYPANEQDIAEFATAIEQAKEKVWAQPIEVVQAPVVETTDSWPPFEGIKNPDSGSWEQTGPAFEETKTATAVAEVKVPPMEAPPGTPGEVWDTPIKEGSEQQSEDNLDKIYKASTEKLAKEHRTKGWFQATFPKRDDK